MPLEVVICCSIISILSLAVAVVLTSSGAIGEGALIFLFVTIAICYSVVALSGAPPPDADRMEANQRGVSASVDYFFPEATFFGKVMGVTIGLVIDLIIAGILLSTVGPLPQVEMVIFAVPITFWLAKSFVVVSTLPQTYEFGAAFWGAVIIGGGLAIISNAVVASVFVGGSS